MHPHQGRPPLRLVEGALAELCGPDPMEPGRSALGGLSPPTLTSHARPSHLLQGACPRRQGLLGSRSTESVFIPAKSAERRLCARHESHFDKPSFSPSFSSIRLLMWVDVATRQSGQRCG